MTCDPELTEELITAAMAKADARVCVGRQPLLCLSAWLEMPVRCTPRGGASRLGRQQGGRESWDVWLEVRTGLVKLVPQVKA